MPLVSETGKPPSTDRKEEGEVELERESELADLFREGMAEVEENNIPSGWSQEAMLLPSIMCSSSYGRMQTCDVVCDLRAQGREMTLACR